MDFSNVSTILKYQLFDNTIFNWILAFSSMLLLFFFLSLMKYWIGSNKFFFKKWMQAYTFSFLKPAVNKTSSFVIFIIALYFAVNFLTLPSHILHFLRKITIISFLFQILIWIYQIINSYNQYYIRVKSTNNHGGTTAINYIAFMMKVIVFSLLFMIALDQLGVNITTLIAGLGVGGIAIALAVQNILGDLFASLTIIIDKPFESGDFLVVGEFKGTVEKVGLKTTRLKSLSGEQLVFSNADLLQSRIRNFQKLVERRIIFEFGVLYETPVDKLKIIPGLIKEIIQSHEKTRFDRAHFKNFAESALNFEVVYFVLHNEYNFFMEIQQKINFQLMEELNTLNVQFAYPTRTIHVVKENQSSNLEREAINA